MNIGLSRFRVKEGKSSVVDEWMNFLNENMEEVLLTLDGEKMYVETIFRERDGDTEYLYWYSIQGENGIRVEESDYLVDKKHLEYWNECIDNGYKEILTTPLREYIRYKDNYKKCLGIVGSGNKNFNNQYCLTAKQYSQEFGFPVLYNFELRGLDIDIQKVSSIIETLTDI